jgi:hypothetical protein
VAGASGAAADLFWLADRSCGHFSLVTISAQIAQQSPSESRNGQQSNRQERVWSAGRVRRIKDRK